MYVPLGICCLSIDHLFTFYTCIYVYLSFNYIFYHVSIVYIYILIYYLPINSLLIFYLYNYHQLSIPIHQYACLMTYIHPSIFLSLYLSIIYLLVIFRYQMILSTYHLSSICL